MTDRKNQLPHPVTAATARQLLEDLANLPECARSDLPKLQSRIRVLARRFPQLFGELSPPLTDQGAITEVAPESPDNSFVMAVIGLARHVRSVWELAQNQREAEWLIFELRRLYSRIVGRIHTVPVLAALRTLIPPAPTVSERALAELEKSSSRLFGNLAFGGWYPEAAPPLTAFDQVMDHFHRMLPQARRCANKDCENPYFFSYKRGKFCSEECGNLGKAQYKRDWWHREGKNRRQKKQKSKRRAKR
jgi:hypothetical protein